WQKALGGSGPEESNSVQVTADGGCIVAGTTESNDGDVSGNHGTRDYWVVKLDNAGSIQWKKCYGGSYFEEGFSIKSTTGGGFIVAGYTASNDGDVSGNHFSLAPGFRDFWVVKLDVSGNIQWQKCYGGDKNEMAYYIQEDADGGYLVTGSSESSNGDLNCNAGITDAWVLKINNLGVIQWQKSMGGSLYEESFGIKPLTNGGYIFCGITCSKEVSGYHPANSAGSCADFWVIKFGKPAAVQPAPQVTINPATGIVCAGGKATFTASVLYGGTNTSYQWMVNGAPAGNNSEVFNAMGLTNNDKIVCTVTSGGSCETATSQASNTVTIQIDNNIVQSLISIVANNTIICDCTPVTFKATVSNAGASPRYDWQVNNISTGNTMNVFTSNSLNDGDIVSCIYTDNATCIAKGSVTSNTIQVQRAANQLPTVHITATNDTICEGATVLFTATAQNAGIIPSYQWQVNGVNTGTGINTFSSSSLNNHDKVSCTIKTDPLFVCTQAVDASSNIVEVIVNNKVNPVINITTSSTIICAGTLATFNAAASNAGTNLSYQWKINGVNAGTDSKTFATSVIQNNDIVSCSITTDPLYPCALSANAVSNNLKMEIITGIPASINITASANEICEGEPASFNAVVLNAGVSPLYAWKLNNLPTGTNDPVYKTSVLKDGDEVRCDLTTGAGGCLGAPVPSNTIVPVVSSAPVITIIPADTIIQTGSQVQLKTLITGTVSSYTWAPPGQLENSQTLNPVTVHLTENVFYSLMVVSDKGCKATAVSVVKVARDLHMPNAFTPNNDQHNDVFRIPSGVSLKLESFSIYDRWGTRIFVTNDISRGWDGNVNGKSSAAGMYIYIIRGSDKNTPVLLKGSFVLIR
ncbi:MAG: gliding motility-associated C-terminal domain-containing protein, partial [Chitinophagaceae bacterium]